MLFTESPLSSDEIKKLKQKNRQSLLFVLINPFLGPCTHLLRLSLAAAASKLRLSANELVLTKLAAWPHLEFTFNVFFFVFLLLEVGEELSEIRFYFVFIL